MASATLKIRGEEVYIRNARTNNKEHTRRQAQAICFQQNRAHVASLIENYPNECEITYGESRYPRPSRSPFDSEKAATVPDGGYWQDKW
jgi:hypothetical protein